MVLYGNLANVEEFERLPEVYIQLKALQKVKAEDIGDEQKRIIIEENKNFFNLFKGTLKHLDVPRLEVHHKAADIHCVFEGEEAIFFGAVGETTPDGDYIAERDVAFLKGKTENMCILHPGDFLVVMPDEVHSPLNATSSYNCEVVKKAVGKIFYK